MRGAGLIQPHRTHYKAPST